MANLLSAIVQFLSRDLTGKSWQRKQDHPYFGQMVYYGHKEAGRGYWEAELLPPGQEKKIGVTMQGTPASPKPSEEAFCRSVLADLDALFEQCRGAFEPVYSKWVGEPLPGSWRSAFVLDGFEVPPEGDPSNPWEVCYFVNPSHHYFTAQFEGGRAVNVQVDG